MSMGTNHIVGCSYCCCWSMSEERATLQRAWITLCWTWQLEDGNSLSFLSNVHKTMRGKERGKTDTHWQEEDIIVIIIVTIHYSMHCCVSVERGIRFPCSPLSNMCACVCVCMPRTTGRCHEYKNTQSELLIKGKRIVILCPPMPPIYLIHGWLEQTPCHKHENPEPGWRQRRSGGACAYVGACVPVNALEMQMFVEYRVASQWQWPRLFKLLDMSSGATLNLKERTYLNLKQPVAEANFSLRYQGIGTDPGSIIQHYHLNKGEPNKSDRLVCVMPTCDTFKINLTGLRKVRN